MGLMEGYCVANHLPLEILPIDKALSANSKEFELILIDATQTEKAFNQSKYLTVAQMSSIHDITVCAIVNETKNILSKKETLAWIDYFFEVPMLKQLDKYLRKHFHYNPHSFPNRRQQERRHSVDRRSHIDRRNINNSKIKYLTNLPNHKVVDSKKMLVPFCINTNNQSVSFNGTDLELTGKEYKLFCFLATDADRVFSSDEIVNHLWPDDYRATKSDLYQYMHLLRKKVEEDPDNPKWIITIKRVGYKLNTLQ
jgi:DNA-binding winged helix-turn-helix (wHTH) protein